MNLKQIGLALATLGTGVTLGACKKNKDATEVPGASGRGGEGGCGGKKSKEAGCGGKKAKESGCGGKGSQEDASAQEKEGGCGASARSAELEGLEESQSDAATEPAKEPASGELAAQGPEEAPKGPTDEKVEAMSDTSPLSEVKSVKPKKKRRRRKRRRKSKPKKRAGEEVCGEGTCG